MRLIVCFLLISSFSYGQTMMDTLTGKVPNESNRLAPQVEIAFEKMRLAAMEQGIKLQVVSGYRSFERQRQIWNRKYKKYRASGMSPEGAFDKIVEYSTLPGTSRHHWGTEIDVIDSSKRVEGDVLVPRKFYNNGEFVKCREWLENNASQYGFALVYTNDPNRTGFKHEPWHWSFVALSKTYYQNYLNKLDVLEFLRSQEIHGINEISDERLIRYLEEHIKGINPILKE